MKGLRETQRQDRDRRILDAATALFRNRGYEATHIEQIAEVAGVSVGTLYNYYKNKGDLLVAIVSIEVHDVLEAGKAVIDAPPPDIAAALDRLVANYYDHSLVYMDKAMWRHAMAMTLQGPKTPSAAMYIALDAALEAQVTSLIQKLQRDQRIRADIEAGPIGALLFNNLDRMFQTFVRTDGMDLQQLKQLTSVHHRIVAHCLAIPE